MEWAARVLEWLALGLVFVIGAGLAAVLAMFVADRMQTRDAIRRNFPVMGGSGASLPRWASSSGSISLPWTAR